MRIEPPRVDWRVRLQRIHKRQWSVLMTVFGTQTRVWWTVASWSTYREAVAHRYELNRALGRRR